MSDIYQGIIQNVGEITKNRKDIQDLEMNDFKLAEAYRQKNLETELSRLFKSNPSATIKDAVPIIMKVDPIKGFDLQNQIDERDQQREIFESNKQDKIRAVNLNTLKTITDGTAQSLAGTDDNNVRLQIIDQYKKAVEGLGDTGMSKEAIADMALNTIKGSLSPQQRAQIEAKAKVTGMKITAPEEMKEYAQKESISASKQIGVARAEADIHFSTFKKENAIRQEYDAQKGSQVTGQPQEFIDSKGDLHLVHYTKDGEYIVNGKKISELKEDWVKANAAQLNSKVRSASFGKASVTVDEYKKLSMNLPKVHTLIGKDFDAPMRAANQAVDSLQSSISEGKGITNATKNIIQNQAIVAEIKSLIGTGRITNFELSKLAEMSGIRGKVDEYKKILTGTISDTSVMGFTQATKLRLAVLSYEKNKAIAEKTTQVIHDAGIDTKDERFKQILEENGVDLRFLPKDFFNKDVIIEGTTKTGNKFKVL